VSRPGADSATDKPASEESEEAPETSEDPRNNNDLTAILPEPMFKKSQTKNEDSGAYEDMERPSQERSNLFGKKRAP